MLPSGYQELRYISGANSQCFDTLLHLTDQDTLRVRANTKASCNLLGSYVSGAADDNFSIYVGNSYYLRFDGKINSSVASTKNAVVTLELSKEGAWRDGTKIVTFSNAGTFTTSLTLKVGKLDNSTQTKFTGDLYSVEVVGKMNLVPARRKSDGEVGMYDTIRDLFFTSEGADWVAGPEVYDSSKPLLFMRRRAMMGAAKHFEIAPGSDGFIWAYYDVTSTETATKVCNNTGFISGSYMVVDGVQVAKATTYLFSTAGRHLVKFLPITSWGSTVQYFASTPALVEIYFPEVAIQLPYRVFQSNTGLEKVSSLDNAQISLYANGQQFRNCTALLYLRLPITQAATVPSNVLVGCTSLKTIELSGSGTLALSTNDPFATGNTPNLDKIVFGPNYTAITGRLASGSAITKMVVMGTTPPAISASSTAFSGWSVSHKIYVPYSADHSILAAYKGDTNWSAQEANIYELNPDGTLPTD